MEPIISIVVPVYKVEKYIHRCLASLINQTLKNIEIILVDDGSPDNCPAICDQIAEKDSRVKVVHKKNGGLSSARNAGMNIAKGKYIGFVDSDDDVELNMYEKMVAMAEKHSTDFVMADYKRVLNNGSSYIKTLDIEAGYYNREKIVNIIFPNLIMREIIDYGPFLSVWHCIYRKSFLDKYGLRFDEEVKWSEDNIFSSIMGYSCSSFYYMKGEALYHYYSNPNTITSSFREGSWQVYCTMNKHLHQFFDDVSDYDFSRQLKLHMIYYACDCTNQESTLSNRSEAVKGIKKILNTEQLIEAFKDFSMPDVSIKLKIVLYLMKWRKSFLLYCIKRSHRII